MATRKYLILSALSLALVFVFSSSCRRNKDCDLVVTVVDAGTNGPIVGALIEIAPNQTSSNGNLQSQIQTANTDNAGVATFTFKLPAILSATVTNTGSVNAPNPTLIKLEEGRSVSKKITCS